MSEERRVRFEEGAGPLIEPLRAFLRRRTDPDTAEDVLADTLLVCWRRLEDLPAEPLPWAYGVARHCLDNARRGQRRRDRLAARVAAVDPPPPATAAPAPADLRVRDALAALPDADAELLRLWAWEGLEAADVAEVLAITPNAAAIRLHRARRKLREQLEQRERKDGSGAGHGQVRGRTQP